MDDITHSNRPPLVPLRPAPPLEHRPVAESGDFKTPEEIARNEGPASSSGNTKTTDQASLHSPEKFSAKHSPKLHNRLKRWWHRQSKKQKVLLIVAAVLILGAGTGGTIFALSRHHKTLPVVSKPKPKAVIVPKPTTVASTLTGLPVDPGVNQRPVTGVMIENSDDARPQSGLDQAGVVFEAVAEGGITRFLALFQDTQPGYLGPVRSARPYYVQWCLGFDCALAHVGGSPEALSDIKTWGAKDLDQFANGNFYQRITSRYAPHNVYTSIAQLNQLEASKGFGAPGFTGFARKADQPLKVPTAKSIDLTPSSADFASHYDYNPITNNYNRSEGGAGHVELDANGIKTQIVPKTIVALVMQQGIEADDDHTSYGTIGNGQAYIFQDGGVTIGTWSKSSNTAQIVLNDAQNKAIKLNAGQTWFTILGNASFVSYHP